MKRYRMLDDMPPTRGFGSASRGGFGGGFGGPGPSRGFGAPPMGFGSSSRGRGFGAPPSAFGGASRFGGPSRGRGFGVPSSGFGAPPRGFGGYDDYYDDFGPPERYLRGMDVDDIPLSPFLQRAMRDDYYEDEMDRPRKEDILMDLGHTVLSSLKGGKKLSENPEVREKIEALLLAETGDVEPPPFRGPHNRYDSYYESDFTPPGPRPEDFEIDRPAPARGFPSIHCLDPAPEEDASNCDWYKFHRVGQEYDHTRIYATEREIAQYFETAKKNVPLKLPASIRNRLKNSFSYEISQCKKNEKRRNFLILHHTKISKEPAFVMDPAKRNKEGDIRRARNESAWKKEKKKMRDKRPPQNESQRRITNYLKFLLFELCGEENKEHVVLILRSITTNPNIIKCLMTECKKAMDEKFGKGKELVLTNKKRAYLIAAHKKHMEDTRRQLLSLNKNPSVVDDSIYETYDDVLSDKKQDPDAFAKPEDFVIHQDRTQDEFIVDYKYEFVKVAFDKFNFKVVETFCITQDLRKRINFFMNNGFLSGLIVQEAKGQLLQLPGMAMKYMTAMDRPCREANERVDGKLMLRAKAMEDYAVVTNPDDFLEQKHLPLETQEVFKKCVSLFDDKATVIKLQLVEYTPFIALTREYKLYVLNEIMKFVYLQCLEMVGNQVNPMIKSYKDMEP